MQPVPGSANASAAAPMTRFSPFLASRNQIVCTGLCEADKVKAPRGLSIVAARIAAANSLIVPGLARWIS